MGQDGYFNHVDGDIRGLDMSPPPLGSFPWPFQLTEKQRKAKRRQGEMSAPKLIEFISDVGKACFPQEYRDPKFLEAITVASVDYLTYRDDIGTYGFLFPQMIGMQHANLQADNGYFWRDADGVMDCGLIDWGGASPKHMAQTPMGCLTGCEGEILDEHQDGFFRCLLDEFYKECGIKVDFGEFRRQFLLNYCGHVAGRAMDVEVETYREVPREKWPGIKSIWDDQVVGIWCVRCQVFMLLKMLKYLHLRWVRHGRRRLHCHDTVVEWVDYWQQHGMS